MKAAMILLVVVSTVAAFADEVLAKSSHSDSKSAKSSSSDSYRPRIGHHSGMNGPSEKGWGGGGGYHQ
jgi:hypothetical protein